MQYTRRCIQRCDLKRRLHPKDTNQARFQTVQTCEKPSCYRRGRRLRGRHPYRGYRGSDSCGVDKDLVFHTTGERVNWIGGAGGRDLQQLSWVCGKRWSTRRAKLGERGLRRLEPSLHIDVNTEISALRLYIYLPFPKMMPSIVSAGLTVNAPPS